MFKEMMDFFRNLQLIVIYSLHLHYIHKVFISVSWKVKFSLFKKCPHKHSKAVEVLNTLTACLDKVFVMWCQKCCMFCLNYLVSIINISLSYDVTLLALKERKQYIFNLSKRNNEMLNVYWWLFQYILLQKVCYVLCMEEGGRIM